MPAKLSEHCLDKSIILTTTECTVGHRKHTVDQSRDNRDMYLKGSSISHPSMTFFLTIFYLDSFRVLVVLFKLAVQNDLTGLLPLAPVFPSGTT